MLEDKVSGIINDDPEQEYAEAIRRAKALWYATADGDVETLHAYTTEEFFNTQYMGFSDDELREELLSVPVEKRERLKKHIDESEIEVIPGEDGDYLIIFFNNTHTGKEMMFTLIDENANGDWRVTGYEY